MPYTRQQLLAAARKDHPQFVGIPDNKLFAAIAQDHPDLARGISELQAPSPVAAGPEPLPNKGSPWDNPWETAKSFIKGGPAGLLKQAATAEPSVMSDLMVERLKGIPEAVTGIPDFVRSLAPLGRLMQSPFAGNAPPDPADIEATIGLGKGAVKGVTEPFTPKGLSALLAPESAPSAPSDEEFRQQARGQGTMLGGVVLGAGFNKAGQAAKTFVEQRPVRLGRTTLDPATNKPVPPPKPIKWEVGEPKPEIPKGDIPGFAESTDLVAKGLNIASDAAGDELKGALQNILPDLRHAQRAKIRSAMDTAPKVRAAVDWSMDRIWRESLEDHIINNNVPMNVRQLIPELRASLPDFVKLFKQADVEKVVGGIEKVLNEYGEIPVKDMHKLAQSLKDEAGVAATPYEAAQIRKTAVGEISHQLHRQLREAIYKHIEQTRGVDVRRAAQKYGDHAKLKGEAATLTSPKGFFEELFTSYTFPTPRAVTARVGETAGKFIAYNQMRQLRRGFEKYKLDESKVTRGQPSRYAASKAVMKPATPPAKSLAPEQFPRKPHVGDMRKAANGELQEWNGQQWTPTGRRP